MDEKERKYLRDIAALEEDAETYKRVLFWCSLGTILGVVLNIVAPFLGIVTGSSGYAWMLAGTASFLVVVSLTIGILYYRWTNFEVISYSTFGDPKYGKIHNPSKLLRQLRREYNDYLMEKQ